VRRMRDPRDNAHDAEDEDGGVVLFLLLLLLLLRVTAEAMMAWFQSF